VVAAASLAKGPKNQVPPAFINRCSLSGRTAFVVLCSIGSDRPALWASLRFEAGFVGSGRQLPAQRGRSGCHFGHFGGDEGGIVASGVEFFRERFRKLTCAAGRCLAMSTSGNFLRANGRVATLAGNFLRTSFCYIPFSMVDSNLGFYLHTYHGRDPIFPSARRRPVAAANTCLIGRSRLFYRHARQHVH